MTNMQEAQHAAERVQQAVERIQEDERLRGDLEDTAARALVGWASERATAVAGDPARSDEEVEQALLAIRRAARLAARSGAVDAGQVVTAAADLLRQQEGAAPAAGAAGVELPAVAPQGKPDAVAPPPATPA